VFEEENLSEKIFTDSKAVSATTCHSVDRLANPEGFQRGGTAEPTLNLTGTPATPLYDTRLYGHFDQRVPKIPKRYKKGRPCCGRLLREKTLNNRSTLAR
jgi:hypothetical protein